MLFRARFFYRAEFSFTRSFARSFERAKTRSLELKKARLITRIFDADHSPHVLLNGCYVSFFAGFSRILSRALLDRITCVNLYRTASVVLSRLYSEKLHEIFFTKFTLTFCPFLLARLYQRLTRDCASSFTWKSPIML